MISQLKLWVYYGRAPKNLVILASNSPDFSSGSYTIVWNADQDGTNGFFGLGKGTEYQQLTFSPDTLKLYDMKKWNLYTLLAKYGIPPRVANMQDSKSSLSGTDTDSQHRAFWNFTLIPLLQNFEQVLEVQFFRRFKLSEKGVFNLESIPELQESEDAQSNRDIAEINAGLKTINDVLRARGQEEKTWGDIWYRQSSLIPVSSNTDTGEI